MKMMIGMMLIAFSMQAFAGGPVAPTAYGTTCASCHGQYPDGYLKAETKAIPQARNFNNKADFRAGFTTKEKIIESIDNGIPAGVKTAAGVTVGMMAKGMFAQLSAKDKSDLADYVIALMNMPAKK